MQMHGDTVRLYANIGQHVWWCRNMLPFAQMYGDMKFDVVWHQQFICKWFLTPVYYNKTEFSCKLSWDWITNRKQVGEGYWSVCGRLKLSGRWASYSCLALLLPMSTILCKEGSKEGSKEARKQKSKKEGQRERRKEGKWSEYLQSNQ